MTTPNNAFQVEPYLVFNGNCAEALAFYQQALGAQVDMIHRFKDSPDPSMCPPGLGDKIMHVSFRVGNNRLMASDGQCQPGQGFSGFHLSIGLKDEARAEQIFAKLSDGGKVQMPLTKTFWAPKFGMVTDRFGVSWMINVEGPPPQM